MLQQPEVVRTIDATNTEGRTALHVAALNSQQEIATLLLSKGADANKLDGQRATPLSYAFGDWLKSVFFKRVDNSEKALETMSLLIKKGADKNLPIDETGETMLEVIEAYPNMPKKEKNAILEILGPDVEIIPPGFFE